LKNFHHSLSECRFKELKSFISCFWSYTTYHGANGNFVFGSILPKT